MAREVVGHPATIERTDRAERYRDNSSLRASALALSGTGIVSQCWLESPPYVKVVIMNRGRAEVLLRSCETASVECPLLSDAAVVAQNLFARIADDGVQHVVSIPSPWAPGRARSGRAATADPERQRRQPRALPPARPATDLRWA